MAIFNLANILQTSGRFDDAEAAYRRVIDIQPDHAYSYRQLAMICGRLMPQGDLEAMEGLLSRPAVPDNDIVELCHGLAAALPNCRIIHCLRNPVDTCLSCFQQLFTNGHGYSCDLEELGHYYAGYVRLMEHWRTVLPGRIYDLDYASLVADQEAETRKLLDFCGLSFERSCLDFYKTERSVLTPSTTQVRRPIYGGSIDKWRRYESHLGPLLTELDKIPAENGENCVLSD